MELFGAYFAGLLTFPALILIVGFLLMFLAVHAESAFIGLIILVGMFAGLWWVGVNATAYAYEHPLVALVVALSYFPIGIFFWSRFKLRRYARKEGEKLAEFVPKFIAETKRELQHPNTIGGYPDAFYTRENSSYGSRGDAKYNMTVVGPVLEALLRNEIPEALQAHFKEDCRRKGLEKPSAIRMKDKIFSWIFFWPWSMIAYLVADFLRDIFNQLWKHLVEMYKRDIDKAYGKAVDPKYNIDSRS